MNIKTKNWSRNLGTALFAIILFSCAGSDSGNIGSVNKIQGTWKLISGTTIEKGDTALTDYTKDQEMIKIINNSHFAFLRHDLNKGKDSSKAIYSSGGGRYSIKGDQYTEQLDYCDAREWEGHTFQFEVSFNQDTLIQRGVEKNESLGIDRLIIEKYVR